MYQSRWAPKPEEQKADDTKAKASETKPTQPKTAEPIVKEEKKQETKVEEPKIEEAKVEQPKIEETRPTTSSSALSAEATTFAPTPATAVSYEPLADSSSYDYDNFAQTGGDQDDLFDDFIPVDESERIRADEDLFNDDFTPVAEPVVEETPVAPTEPEPIQAPDNTAADATPATSAPATRGDGSRGRGGRGRERGRGRGRGNAQARGGHSVQPATTQAQTNEDIPAKAAGSAPENAPTGPRKDSVPSVRGDRHATGGLKKPKLTEEELAEKMARISVKNASLTAAHARAEADAASFAQRESKAKEISAQRLKEERRDRQQMMGEREKNRMRKLKAMEGREWDAEKNEDDFQKGGLRDKKGGFAGDDREYNDGREYLYKEPRGGDRARGSGRSGRGGRSQEQATPKKEEFPALPTTANKPTAAATEDALTSITAGPKTSWADQVESSNAS